MEFRRARPAMATRFDFRLVGDDPEHLAVVADSALDEVDRVERLLSRHDPASEVSRINREARDRPVRVAPELFRILQSCLRWSEWTAGYFDPCATSCHGASYRLDEGSRTIRLVGTGASMDLGGFGKGYALDVAAKEVFAFGVRSFLLDGGTSSILAMGVRDDGSPWRVHLDPLSEGSGLMITLDPSCKAVSSSAVFAAVPARSDLIDPTSSSSAIFGDAAARSDIIDPTSGSALDRQAGCSVIGPAATIAEVYSTALLAMGRARAARFVRGWRTHWSRVAWFEPGCSSEWLTGG